MNAEILKQAGIDYERGVKRFAGRAPLYDKTLVKFTRDTTFSRIREAREAGDKDAFFATVHEFKGMCGNVALTSLYEGADKLVRMLREGGHSEAELTSAYEALAEEYGKIYSAVVAAMEESV